MQRLFSEFKTLFSGKLGSNKEEKSTGNSGADRGGYGRSRRYGHFSFGALGYGQRSYGTGSYRAGGYRKYRGILISVALFLLLDASIMALNFYVSFEIAADAVGVNLAGRQRMLSQRMVKSLFSINSEAANSKEFADSVVELSNSTLLFDETLTAFARGGKVHSAGKDMVVLPAVKTPEAIKNLRTASDVWKPYRTQIDALLSAIKQHGDLNEVLPPVLVSAKQKNLQLLGLMNDLTLNLEQVASSKASRLRTIQTVGITLAIINFLFIMLHFLRQLRDSDAVLEKACNETVEILQTVNEGLFLVDQDLRIGDQYSAKLVEILGVDNIAGQSFQELLGAMVSEKDAETARSFIELLFAKQIKEKLIGDLNPLQLVEVNIGQSSGGFLTKYLQFNFARAYQGSRISHVLVTVVDISEKIRLERALDESRKNTDSQIEMLTSLLHTHPSLLREFLNNSFQTYNRINNILRQPAKATPAIREKSVSIFREIHNFKGEAASLHLTYFEDRAHAIEDTLESLRAKRDLTGNDYLELTVQLESLISYTQQVQDLVEKLSIFGHQSPLHEKKSTGTRQQDGWAQLDDFVQSIARRHGKVVRFVESGLRDIELDPEYGQHVKEICIQLLRNAVTHGIEHPADRELTQKPIEGRVDLRIAKLSNTEMEISVMDDGAGLDYSAIRERAIESGRWSEDEIESWDNKNLLALIFHEGFSTAPELSKDAGRGMGMESVMTQVLKHRGKITVSSRRGHHCRFVVTMPIVPVDEEVAA